MTTSWPRRGYPSLCGIAEACSLVFISSHSRRLLLILSVVDPHILRLAGFVTDFPSCRPLRQTVQVRPPLRIRTLFLNTDSARRSPSTVSYLPTPSYTESTHLGQLHHRTVAQNPTSLGANSTTKNQPMLSSRPPPSLRALRAQLRTTTWSST